MASDQSASETYGEHRYTLGEELGRGGSGIVHRARDRQLDRWVALKRLHAAEERDELRFLQEARAQAKVQHDNVCRIYEVGRDDQGVFLALQLIEGKTLSVVAKELTLEQRVAVVRQIALAVHEAHRVGLIHRDIKPANILIERGPDGAIKPYITDFGLVRDLSAAGETVTGTVLGTPRYMAPEQARGQRSEIDRRSDVYSLGATLYEVLTLVPLFQGDSGLQILFKVLHQEPVPPRALAPEVPRDLESVTLKCLDKRKAGRYGSALELADDLGRWLDGLPVRARPAGPLDRALRFARKNPALAATSSLSALALLVGLGLFGWQARTARRRELVAQRFGRDVEQVQSALRFSALLPLHDRRPERRELTLRMAALEQEAQRQGSAAQAPAQVALARGYYALGDLLRARAAIDQAWALGDRSPAAAYARGLVLGGQYAQEGLRLRVLVPEQDLPAEKARVDRELRAPALEGLRVSGAPPFESAAFVEALALLYQGDYPQAIARAQQAAAEHPWLYEAHLVAGEAHRLAATDLVAQGKFPRADAEYQVAQAAFEEAARLAPSDERTHLAVCTVQAWRYDLHKLDTDPALATLGDAMVRSCERGLAANPDSQELRTALADLHAMRIEVAALHGHDPTAEVARVRELAAALVSLPPSQEPGHAALHPHHEDVLECLGRAEDLLGVYLAGAGKAAEAQAAFERAREALVQAVAAAPTYAKALAALGTLSYERALRDQDQGRDPAEAVRGCVESFDRIIALLPKMGRPRQSRANCLRVGVEWALAHGQPVEDSLARLASAYDDALRLSPTPTRYLGVGQVHLLRGRLLLEAGHDPGPEAAAADGLCREAQAKNGKLRQAKEFLLAAGLLPLQWAVASGGDVSAPRARVERDLAALEPATPGAAASEALLRVRARIALAEASAALGDRATVQRQLALAGEVVPALPKPSLERLEAASELVDAQRRLQGRAGKAEIALAGEAAQAAVARSPGSAAAWLSLARVQAAAAGPSESAVQASTKALEQNPRSWEALLLRSVAHARGRQWAQARADFAAAVALAPLAARREPALARQLEAARAPPSLAAASPE